VLLKFLNFRGQASDERVGSRFCNTTHFSYFPVSVFPLSFSRAPGLNVDQTPAKVSNVGRPRARDHSSASACSSAQPREPQHLLDYDKLGGGGGGGGGALGCSGGESCARKRLRFRIGRHRAGYFHRAFNRHDSVAARRKRIADLRAPSFSCAVHAVFAGNNDRSPANTLLPVSASRDSRAELASAVHDLHEIESRSLRALSELSR